MTNHMKVKLRLGWYCKETYRYRRAGVVRSFFTLVVLAVMRCHDFHHQFSTSRVRKDVPAIECATPCIPRLVNFLRAEQGLNGLFSKRTFTLNHQLLHGATQDALDTAPCKIREPIWRKKGKAVFDRVFIA